MDLHRLMNIDMSKASKDCRTTRQFPRTPFPFDNARVLRFVHGQSAKEAHVEHTGDTTCSECESSGAELPEERALTPEVVSVGQTPSPKGRTAPHGWKNYVEFNGDQDQTSGSHMSQMEHKPSDLVSIYEQDLIQELTKYDNPQDLAIEEAQIMEANLRRPVGMDSQYDGVADDTTFLHIESGGFQAGEAAGASTHRCSHECSGTTEYIQEETRAPRSDQKRYAPEEVTQASPEKKPKTEEPSETDTDWVYLRAADHRERRVHPDFQIVAVHGEKHGPEGIFYKVTWKDSWIPRSEVPWIDEYIGRHGRHWDVLCQYVG